MSDAQIYVNDVPHLFDERIAADYIGMSMAFLRCGRSRGTVGNRTPSPPFLKLGRSVRYDRRDLDEWLAARRRTSTAQGSAA